MHACSGPPTYWSTGSSLSAIALSMGRFMFFASQYLIKYHDESTNVSMVSVSLRAAPPHFGHVTFMNDCDLSSGLPLPVNSTSRGSITGKFSSFSMTMPHLSQYMAGIGVGFRSGEHTSEFQSHQYLVF